MALIIERPESLWHSEVMGCYGDQKSNQKHSCKRCQQQENPHCHHRFEKGLVRLFHKPEPRSDRTSAEQRSDYCRPDEIRGHAEINGDVVHSPTAKVMSMICCLLIVGFSLSGFSGRTGSPQLSERFGFHFSYSLPRNAIDFGHFLKCALPAIVQSEP